MKRMLVLFAAAMVAALALGLWYMPGEADARLYARIRDATAAPADATPAPTVAPVITPEPTEAMTPAPLLTPTPTPVPTPEATEGEDAIDVSGEPGETDGGSPDDTPTPVAQTTPDATPEPTPQPTPAAASPSPTPIAAATPAPTDAVIAIADTPAPTQSASNKGSVAVPTPIPRTPRTAPPSAPLAYEPSIDESELSSGVITVRVYDENSSKISVQLKKDTTYKYFIKANNNPYRFPLNMGDGGYDLGVYKNITGDSYSILTTQKLSVSLSSANAPFLQSIQIIDWDASMAPMLEAQKFARDSGNPTDAIHQRLANYLMYDYAKLGKLPSGYIPDITDTYDTGKGICYDMSALYASMLRSIGVPARLVMGNSKLVSGYHAWNEVYVNGSWVVVDLTVDAQLRDSGEPYEFAKKSSDYSSVKYRY